MGEGNDKALPQTPTPMVWVCQNIVLLIEAYKNEHYTSIEGALLWSKSGLKQWPPFDPMRFTAPHPT